LLEADGYLPPGSAKNLTEGYWLLRNAEHAQQGYQDKQTQAMPCDEKGEARMAWVLNYDNWAELDLALQFCRDVVNSEFQSVIADPEDSDDGQSIDLHDWQSMWLGTLDLESAQTCLVGAQKDQVERVLSILKSLRESRVVLTMQASGRDRLESFMPRLLSTLAQENQGAALVETLSRIMVLVEAVVRRSAYLVLLLENPDALQQLVKLCGASPWIADQLAKYPALLDELLDARSLYTPPDKLQLQDELRQDTLRLAWDDLEGHMDTLRHFRQAHALRVAASEVANILPLMKVSDYLTDIAEVILEHVLAVAWEQMVARHGYPTTEDGSSTEADFIIVGYGKLGGIELGHGSDLDLVFIHDTDLKRYTDGERSIDNQTFYTRLGQRIIHILSTKMASGELYETDMRLRPSGNSGLLVSSLSAFEKYQMQEAWVWEHQALVRARVVAGSAHLAKRFAGVRERVLVKKRELTPLAEEVFKMREKMRQHLGSSSVEPAQFHLKQDSGGIVDIEFMVQYAVLAWAEKSPALVRYTDNIRILGCLEQMQLLSEDSTAQLIDAYKAYRSAGHRLALQRQSVTVEGSQFTTEREAVKRLWQQWLPTTL
jgi:glutamate-ammonia-ligase adenylyltransferase